MKLTVVALALLVAGASYVDMADAAKSSSDYFTTYTTRLGEGALAASNDIKVDSKDAVLFIIDMQNDFVGEFTYTEDDIARGLSPCNHTSACFGVHEGNDTAEAIAELLANHTFAGVVATLDDHSPEHCSASLSDDCTEWLETGGEGLDDFHGCVGSTWRSAWAAEDPARTMQPFPPHSVRGLVGSHLDATIQDALRNYAARNGSAASIAVKGLDITTDSFGALPYTAATFDFYKKAGLLDPNDPHPAQLIRSMLTWERRYNESTGANTFVDSLGLGYVQPPPFGDFVGAGPANSDLEVKSAWDVVTGTEGVDSIIVTGLALDWCVADTALNAKALNPDLNVYIAMDAARPSFLPMEVCETIGMVKPKDPSNQIFKGGMSDGSDGCWLHDPADFAKVMAVAGIKLITTAQIV